MLISIDFEYRKSNEKHPELVCCALKGRQHKKALKFWLHECPSERARLKSVLQMLIGEGAVFLSYQATAEARCFLALGINPLSAQWIDLYVEWRQIRNKNDRFLFGPYVDNEGNPCESSARGTDRNMIGGGLSDAVYYFFRADLNAANKDRMRKIILAGGPFDPQTATEILAYCAADIEYLSMLYDAIRANNKYLDAATALRRGRYTACLALTESLGIPIRLDRVMNVSQNQASIARHFYLEANKLFPFFLETKRGFVQSYDQFCKFVASKGLEKKWPKTEGGASGRPKYAMNDKAFKKYSHFPEIAMLQRCKTSITHVGFFKPARIGEFLECVGSDGRARPWIGPFGTQTGRNAPPASQYVFAMASWLRSIVEPKYGRTILGADESAQEFAIAAVLSGDKNMIEAYNSGDPYLGYAKQSGGIAQNATREDPVVDALRDEYKSSCLASNTLVRVRDRGYVEICRIKPGDIVWDGHTWRVCRGGAVYRGKRQCSTFDGLVITPDHNIYIGENKYAIGKCPKRAQDAMERSRRTISRSDISWRDVWSLGCHVWKVYQKIYSKRVSRALRGMPRRLFMGRSQSFESPERQIDTIEKFSEDGHAIVWIPPPTMGANDGTMLQPGESGIC